MVQRVDAPRALLRREALWPDMRVGDRDHLYRADLPVSLKLGEMHLPHETVVAADAETIHLGGAGMQEVAEPVKDQLVADALHALGHMRVMTDDQVDALVLRGELAPIAKLTLVRDDAAFETVVNGEDAVVGR